MNKMRVGFAREEEKRRLDGFRHVDEHKARVVAKLMWDADCGFVPMNDAVSKVVGRTADIWIASATRRLPPEPITATPAMCCASIPTTQPEETTDRALATMKRFEGHRLLILRR